MEVTASSSPQLVWNSVQNLSSGNPRQRIFHQSTREPSDFLLYPSIFCILVLMAVWASHYILFLGVRIIKWESFRRLNFSSLNFCVLF